MSVHSLDSAPVVAPPPADDVIDLRRYIGALARWWREILLFALLLALLGAGAVWLLKAISTPLYSSAADVAIVRTVSEVSFDERFQTQSEAPAASNVSPRRNALLALAGNPALANDVLRELKDALPENLQNPVELARRVTTALATVGSRGDSDLIRITVLAETPELAAQIATSWAQNYVNRVNQVYGQAPDAMLASVEAEQTSAKAALDAAQQAYSNFLKTTPYFELTRQVTDKEDTIQALLKGRQDAFAALIQSTVDAVGQVAHTQASEQAKNISEPYAAEQAAKRAAVAAALGAIYQGQADVVTQQVQRDQQLLAGQYTRWLQVTRSLDEARALRTLIDASSSAADDPVLGSNALVLSLLKLQAFTQSLDPQPPSTLQAGQSSEQRTAAADASATSAETPANTATQLLQTSQPVQVDVGATPLQIQLSDRMTVTRQALLDDTDALVQTLAQRQSNLAASIQALSAQILSGAQYENVLTTPPADNALVETLRTQAPALLAQNVLTGATSTMSATAPLLGLTSAQVEQLFPTAALAAAADKAHTGAAAAAIAQLEDELRQLRAQLEDETAKLQRLVQERDRNADTFKTVSNKMAELTVARSAISSEVRFAAPGMPADEPEAGLSPLLLAALGGVAGLLLGLVAAFVADALGAQPPLARRRSTAVA